MKIGPGGPDIRPGAQGKRPQTSKTNGNSGTLPRLEGDLHQNFYFGLLNIASGPEIDDFRPGGINY